MESSKKYCIIGAGPSGLTVAKNFKQRGIPFDCFEREDDVGGNWYYGKPNSSVYRSTHFISSKRMTEYVDFPMPREFPPYPSHRQALDYLRAYATEFGLYDDITFNTSATRAEPDGDAWQVTLDDGGQPRKYKGVVVANGHHWDPKLPRIEGSFNGQVIHSHDYKTPDLFAGRRVLVVGAGNSGCDIAVEAGQNAKTAFHSMRRGYHFLPKFIFGSPVDSGGERLHRWGAPLWLQRWVTGFLVRIALGRPQRYGLPAPDHKLFETHPIINSQLLYYIGHGAIKIKPDIKRLCGDKVRFVDGGEEEIDLIVYATGYRVSFPFLDKRLFYSENGRLALFLNAFHPRYDNLFAAGLIQPNSGLWGLVDYQAQLMAAFIAASEHGRTTAEWFRRKKAKGAANLGFGVNYIDSSRHEIEVEYYHYRRSLQRLLKQFGDEAYPESLPSQGNTAAESLAGNMEE